MPSKKSVVKTIKLGKLSDQVEAKDRFNRLLIFYFVLTLHLVWAYVLIFYGNSISNLHVTSIDNIWRVVHSFPVMGWMFLLSSIAALIALIKPFKGIYTSPLLLIPQQFLLLWQALGAIISIYNGEFADHVVRTVQFLTIDQIIYVVLAVFHSVSFFKNFVFEPFKRIK